MLTMRLFCKSLLAAAGLVATTAPATADFSINLTAANSEGTSQGAIFRQRFDQPTGTGVFNPFVRIDIPGNNGIERGYNTDARPVEFETKDENQWTHSVLLGTLTPVKVNGVDYYRFDLDINEPGSDNKSPISLNDFRVFLGNSPSLTGWNNGFGANAVEVYNLDLDSRGNGTVELDAKLVDDSNPPGSGVADMSAFVPVTYFQNRGSQFQYVYLYSAFGNPNLADAGYEEWRVLGGRNPRDFLEGAPAPPAAVLALIGLVGCGFGGYLRRRHLSVAG